MLSLLFDSYNWSDNHNDFTSYLRIDLHLKLILLCYVHTVFCGCFCRHFIDYSFLTWQEGNDSALWVFLAPFHWEFIQQFHLKHQKFIKFNEHAKNMGNTLPNRMAEAREFTFLQISSSYEESGQW